MEFVNDPIARRIREAAGRGTLSHALLFSGSGDRIAAAQYAAAAMECQGGGQKPCGTCPACRKVFSGIHPDVITVRDEAHKNLSVDTVRQIRADAYIRPNEGARKVYIFPDCTILTEQDQNVLLKIVEEGPPYAAFLFCAENSSVVLQTLRSRCVELKLHPAAEGGGEEVQAAEALCRCLAARKRGKQARIVIDREHTAAETLIARLDALPEYMRLTSAVSLNKVLTVDELADIMARHPDVDFLSANVWVDGAYNYDTLHCSLQHMMLVYGDDLEEDYPGLQLREYKNLTGEDITQHFRAMVQYLAEHPEVAKAGPDEPYRYKEMLLNLEEDGLEVLGLWVQGTPDQITALLDEELVRSVRNYDARIQLWT